MNVFCNILSRRIPVTIFIFAGMMLLCAVLRSALAYSLLKDAVTANDVSKVQVALSLGANPSTGLLLATDWRGGRVKGHLQPSEGTYIPANPPPESVALVRLLLTAGADVHSRNEIGCTPLMLASWQGKSATVDLLLERDHDINAQEKDGWTALMLAITSGDMPTIRTLLRHGADVNTVRSIEGYTALSLAEGRGDQIIASLLRSNIARHN